MGAQIKGLENIRNFVTGGRAVFTLKNTASGAHLTFRVSKAKRAKDEPLAPLFVSVRTGGAGRDQNFEFLGTIFQDPRMTFNFSHKSCIDRGHKSVKAMQWMVGHLSSGREFPEALEFWHEGTCCRCGRQMTHPESIASGLGPECAKKV